MPDDLRTDEALLLAYQSGDSLAFEILYARWRGRLYRYFLRQCNHAGHADELFQETFLRIIGAAEHYEVTAKFSTWIFSIAHNLLIDHWRKIGREPLPATPLADEDENREVDMPAPESIIPEHQVAQHQLGAAIVTAVSALPDVQREAFLLAEEGELTLEEIARVTGVGRETIKSRLRYATHKLRAALEGWR
jgi:RNA polymerase sigma factor (sigma-70 family)